MQTFFIRFGVRSVSLYVSNEKFSRIYVEIANRKNLCEDNHNKIPTQKHPQKHTCNALFVFVRHPAILLLLSASPKNPQESYFICATRISIPFSFNAIHGFWLEQNIMFYSFVYFDQISIFFFSLLFCLAEISFSKFIILSFPNFHRLIFHFYHRLTESHLNEKLVENLEMFKMLDIFPQIKDIHLNYQMFRCVYIVRCF